MIDIIIFSLSLPAMAFLACWLGEPIHKKTIVSCRCGRHQSQELLLFDASDEVRIRQTLSELCVFCRASKNHNGELSRNRDLSQGDLSHA